VRHTQWLKSYPSTIVDKAGPSTVIHNNTRRIHKIDSICKYCRCNAAVTACMQNLLVLLEGTGAIFRQSNHVYSSPCVFKMFKKIEKPVAYEMRSVMRFLNARNMKPANIHRQLCEVYGENARVIHGKEMGETLY
jgi:hypothetical protein